MQINRNKKQPLFQCLECGKNFYTTEAANRAAFGSGCPKCGSTDIDTPAFASAVDRSRMNVIEKWDYQGGTATYSAHRIDPDMMSDAIDALVKLKIPRKEATVRVSKAALVASRNRLKVTADDLFTFCFHGKWPDTVVKVEKFDDLVMKLVEVDEKTCSWRIFRRGAYEECGELCEPGKQYCPRHEESSKRKKNK